MPKSANSNKAGGGGSKSPTLFPVTQVPNENGSPRFYKSVEAVNERLKQVNKMLTEVRAKQREAGRKFGKSNPLYTKQLARTEQALVKESVALGALKKKYGG